nr:site-specific integrase [Actinomadura fibrosa]
MPGRSRDNKITIKAFLDRWLTHNLPGTVAESTEDDYKDTVRLHPAPALGRTKLSKPTVLDVDKLWQAKREAGYSANSSRIMWTVLRKALAQAEREGNVAALSAAPHVVAKEGRTLTIDQAKVLLSTVAGHRFEVAIMLALAYGLRRGEVLGLHWSAVDWDAGTIRLTHSVKRIKDRDKASGRKTRLVVGGLKTPKSRRTLVLTPQLVTKLRTLHDRQAKAKIAAGGL